MVDAQPNALEQQISEMTTQLKSKNAGKRREAAYFLGEAAAEDAVPALVDVYENDKDKSVRAAAAYSLGMYKAVERSLKRGDEAEVVALLTRIEEQGKLGSRASSGRTLKIEFALLISLLVIIVLFLIRADVKGLIFGSTKPQAQVIAEARQAFTLVKNDTRKLQSELLDAIANRPLGCIQFYENPAPYQLDPVDARTFRDVAVIVEQLNTAQASLATAKARYDAACNEGAAFGATEAQETFQLLLPALQILDPLELALTQASVAAQPT
ncbi:MAG: HEAT repeat domain-containing protein, partial [Chloroflexota bacterium]